MTCNVERCSPLTYCFDPFAYINPFYFLLLSPTHSLLTPHFNTAHAIAVCRRPVPIYNIKCIFDTRTSHGTNTFQYNFNLTFDYLFIFFLAKITAHTRTHAHTAVFTLCSSSVYIYCVVQRALNTYRDRYWFVRIAYLLIYMEVCRYTFKYKYIIWVGDLN